MKVIFDSSALVFITKEQANSQFQTLSVIIASEVYKCCGVAHETFFIMLGEFDRFYSKSNYIQIKDTNAEVPVLFDIGCKRTDVSEPFYVEKGKNGLIINRASVNTGY